MSKLGRILQRRKNKRLSATIGSSLEKGVGATETEVNGDTAELLPQLQPEMWQNIDQRLLGPARSQTFHGTNSIASLAPFDANGMTDLSEVGGRLMQARFERCYAYASEEERAMGIDLSAAFFRINLNWSAAGNNESDGEADWRSFDSMDADFELVLRHFWRHLGTEKRRKLIQIAAGLLDSSEGCSDLMKKPQDDL